MRSAIRLVVINLVVFAILLAIAIPLFNAITADRSDSKAALPNYAGQPWAKEHFSELRELHTRFSSFVEWRRELFSGETINIVGKYHERKTILPTDAKRPEVFFSADRPCGGPACETTTRFRRSIPPEPVKLHEISERRRTRPIRAWRC